jgi:hypothetical protein
MTGRDRMVLMAVIVIVILGAGWMLVVSPERGKAHTLAAQVTSAQATLATAEGELSKARAAQSQYASAYSAIVNLGKAVPASQEVPSLIYQLSSATHEKNVLFSSIASAGGSGTSAASASPAAVAAASAAANSFSAMPFTFVFNGNFFALEGLFRKLTSFTTRTASGALRVNGRLLTIQSVSLSHAATSTGTGGSSSPAASSKLTGNISASAYVLPAGQTLTGASGSAIPAGGAPTAPTTGAASSPTAPATVTVNP